MTKKLTRKKKIIITLLIGLVIFPIMGVAFVSLSQGGFLVFLLIMGTILIIFERIASYIEEKHKMEKFANRKKEK